MEHCLNRERSRGFTATDLLLVIVVVAIQVVLVMPLLSRYHNGGIRINCASNLKQIGLAFRTWEDDNTNRYPMLVYTNESGTMLYANASNLFRYFQVMSNELNNPKILICPEDKSRSPAPDFDSLSNSHLSYFAGLDADETFPTRLLSGDRSISNGARPTNGILLVTTNQPVTWSNKIHKQGGNVLLADGSVQQVGTAQLKAFLAQTGMETNRLLMP